MPTPARVVVLPREQAPLELHELELPDPGPSQVVVRQYASGICHSQLHHQMISVSSNMPRCLRSLTSAAAGWSIESH